MSERGTHTRGRVVTVAAGLESTDRHVPVRDVRHEALSLLIGKWINEGHTVAPVSCGGTTMAAWYERPMRNVFEIPHVGERSRRHASSGWRSIGISGAPTRYAPPGVVPCAARR